MTPRGRAVTAENGGAASDGRRMWVRHITEVGISNKDKVKVEVGNRFQSIKEATECKTVKFEVRRVGGKQRLLEVAAVDRRSCELAQKMIQKIAKVAEGDDDSDMEYVDAYIRDQCQKRNGARKVPRARTGRDETQVGFNQKEMVKPRLKDLESQEERETKSESERHRNHEDSEFTADACASDNQERVYHGKHSTYTHNSKEEEARQQVDSENKQGEEHGRGKRKEAGIEDPSPQEKAVARGLRKEELGKDAMVWLSGGQKDWE